MKKARQQDNCLALGAFVATWIIGLHLHWYYDYTFSVSLFLLIVFAVWRMPFLWVFSINPKERQKWTNALENYILPEKVFDLEYKKSVLK